MRRVIGSAMMMLAAVSAGMAMEGTVLAVHNGTGAVVRVNVATNSWDTVISKSDFSRSHGLYGPCFSPDGKRVAYTRYQVAEPVGSHLLIADNDGDNITYVCPTFREGLKHEGGIRGVECSWANNGYIYWSEDDSCIYRVDVATKTPELVAKLADFTGELPRQIDNLKVSLDGTRVGCMVNGSGSGRGLDLVTMVGRSYGSGCQVTVSPNGQMVTRSTVNPGLDENYSFHQVGFIHNFETTAIIDTFFAPGAEPNQTDTINRVNFVRFSHSSNDHITFQGEGTPLRGKGFVHQLSTDETVEIDSVQPYDFWAGVLPVPVDGPFIALDDDTLKFESVGGAVPASQTVTVTNTGTGTLGDVGVQGQPAWLTVNRSGSGDSQTLTNEADPSGLEPGVYTATITVSGGGATNSVNYRVTFNVAAALLAPSDLVASPRGADSASVSWTDNSSDEDGFLLERSAGSAGWETLATLEADSTAFINTGLSREVTYRYRVRAWRGTDTSGYSNTDSVRIAAARSITLLAPDGEVTWQVGSTQHIRWTTEGIESVDIQYTTDEGETFEFATDSSIDVNNDSWGDYAWVVPELTVDHIFIRIKQYGNDDVNTWSSRITITPSTVTRGRGTTVGRIGVHRVVPASDGSLVMEYNAGPGGARLRVLSLDGRIVCDRVLTAGFGRCRLDTDASVTALPRGVRIISYEPMHGTREVIAVTK